MVLKVVSDCFLGDLVSDGPGEVSVFPEFTAPEFLLYFRVCEWTRRIEPDETRRFGFDTQD